jgi:hypothetical protein
MQPVCTLCEKLFALPIAEGEVISRHPDERGYATSICLLLAIMTESFIMRARYLNSDKPSSSERNITKFITTRYPDLSKTDELKEIFVLRDTIAHNHLWEIESKSDTNIWTELLKKEIAPLTDQWTDKKYELLVNTNNGTTKKLELHVIPTQINRTDVVKVLNEVAEILAQIDNKENFALGFSNNYVMFRGNYINFLQAVNSIINNFG